MNTKQVKILRGQVRIAVKELLSEIINTELVDTIHAQLNKRLEQRLDGITEHMKTALDQVETRSKDMQNYVVRSVATATQTPPLEATTPEAKTE